MQPLSLRQPVLTLLLSMSASAVLADTPPPAGVLNLSASAQVEVAQDMISVSLSATRDGPDAAAVQAGVKQAIEAALAEARKVAKPGQVDVRTGNFSIFPRYGKQNAITGWHGSADLVIEGRDMPAIAALTGRMPTVTISRVGYGLSREAREKVEADVTAQAVASYRNKAAQLATMFGYGGYTIREVTVNGDGGFAQPVPMMAMRAAKADMAEAPLPVEPGKATVTANVNGSVQMK